jgi:triacylglycerol lipase
MRCSGARAALAVAFAVLACSGDETEAVDGAGTSSSGADTSSTAPATTVPPTDDDDGEDEGDDVGADSSESDSAGVDDSSTGDVAKLGPPYPIVLAHGFFGFESFAGVDFVGYFFGVADRLADEGEPWVYTPAVNPFDDSTARGEQLLAHVETILAETGHEKVNIIGHSQGGLDARVVASLRPDLVASVTTFATPHLGTPISDIVLGLVPDPQAQAAADELAQLFGAALWSEIDGNTSIFESLAQFSTEGIAEFNAMYPDGPGVAYASIAGRSAYHLGGPACAIEDAPPFIADMTAAVDALDGGFAVSGAILTADPLAPAANDGLVRVTDARWGVFLGCVPADHLDEVGQLLGDVPGLTNPWRHDDFYAALVAWLRAGGF